MVRFINALRPGAKNVASLLLLISAILQGHAEIAPSPLPLFVIGPPNRVTGKGVRDLFEQPDGWKATRVATNVILCSDHILSKYSDADLKKYFAQLQAWNIKLELEVGAVKEWGQTGEDTFRKQRPSWDRFQSLGGHIASLAMDEPLSCVRRHLKKPDEYAAQETAKFIGLVQQTYPGIKVIEIEPYPSIPVGDQKMWIDMLQKAVADQHLKPLDAYRLDVDWLNFSMRDKGSWLEVKQIEDDCHHANLPFSLIYWSAGYGYWERQQMADDSTWYVGVMSQGYAYASVGGRPDQYVIESWVGAPQEIVPETRDFTFARSCLDFYNRFIKPAAPKP